MVAKKLKLFSSLRFKNVVIESLAVFDTISSFQKKEQRKLVILQKWLSVIHTSREPHIACEIIPLPA